jgi:hypothetical protein
MAVREIEITVMVHRETGSAWLVSDTSELKDAVWLAKSQADDGGQGQVGQICEFLVPEWIAIDKGLI